MKRMVRTHDIDGVDFVDLRPSQEQRQAPVLQLLHDTMYDLDWAGYKPLVVDNVRIIIGVKYGEKAAPHISGYLCPFSDDLRDKRALACRLVWLATYYSLARGDNAKGGHDDAMLYQRCLDAEIAFVSKFPDGDPWVEFLRAYHSPIEVRQ